ncbi:hypothetical protein [Ferrimonas balearica]|uniref:hypothetical protein n=1 Tax=Ferrimonas balearica TaxID=44012 RepID=UPI001C967B40|nr:hypothetical protein [Ferrimonas balearica]MBY6223568.1 hypothetical protein [Ferrimonas balearica]
MKPTPQTKAEKAVELLPRLDASAGTPQFEFNYRSFLKNASEGQSADRSVYLFSLGVQDGVEGRIGDAIDRINKFAPTDLCDFDDLHNNRWLLFEVGALASVYKLFEGFRPEGEDSSACILYALVCALHGEFERSQDALDYLRRAFPDASNLPAAALHAISETLSIIEVLGTVEDDTLGQLPAFWRVFEDNVVRHLPNHRMFFVSFMVRALNDVGMNEIELLFRHVWGGVSEDVFFESSDWLAETMARLPCCNKVKALFVAEVEMFDPRPEAGVA